MTSYREIDLITKNFENSLSAAEIQGIATGMLCASENAEPGFWLNEMAQDIDEIDPDDKMTLESVFENTKSALAEDGFSYQLFLPDDDRPVNEQAEALRQWCQGFLFGIGSVPSVSTWSDESREVIKDITEFTKLDAGADDEDADSDLMEITEYLRAAAMFLRAELNQG